MLFAGETVSSEQVRGTATLFRWYRAFIRSDKDRARIPWDSARGTMDKAQAQRKLWELVDTAINHKGGLLAPRGRKDSWHYQMQAYRDCQRVRNRVQRRIRVYQFETAEVRERFGHLLSTYGD